MILFRADGNSIVCTGHVMRCLSLADAFRRKGEKCVFVIADEYPKNLIASRGYDTVILGTEYDRLEEETGRMRTLISKLAPNLVILDTYYVTAGYMNALNDLCRLVYIDDLAAFPYPCSALVNYNAYGPYIAYEELYDREKIKKPAQYLGIEYVPLREDFRDTGVHMQPEKVSNVLVSTGGADPEHIAHGLIEFLSGRDREYHYHFIVGSMNADADAICAMAEKNGDITIHRNVTDMKSLMMSCDIAVSAAGSTLYELCACGVPAVTFVFADNQIPGAEAFQKLGLMQYIGDIRENRDYRASIVEAIEGLAADIPLRREISARMQGMVDGRGADRLAERLLVQTVGA